MMAKNARIAGRLLFALIMLCLLPASPLHAQIDQWGYWKNGVSESWWFSTAEFTSEEADSAIARWNAIGAEKQNSSKEWAGDYFRGSDVHGTYVRWSPQGGFVMADIDKCQAKVMRVTYGRVNATATAIEFIPEFRKGSEHHNKMHSEPEPLKTLRFVPVSWRGVLHLIFPEGVSDFCNFAAGLDQANTGFIPEYDYYYKLNSQESEAGGDLPVVPAGYEQFVKKPIEATIERIVSRRVKRIPTGGGAPAYASHSTVVITAGRANGVKRGMFFRVRGSEGDDKVEIIRVARTSSLGVIVRDLDDNASETYYEWATIGTQVPRHYSPIAVGWRVTTAP